MDRRQQFCGAVTRRQMVLATGALTLCGAPATAFASVIEERERRLDCINIRTGEELSVTYWLGGSYLPDALGRISHLLRDIPTGEVKPIDPHLIDLLFAVRRSLRSAAPFAVISGYRTPRTNQMLARRRAGVARRSLHMHGQAVDLLLPGRPLEDVAATALAFRAGGVGYYPASNFVHLDVGPVRRWTANT